MLGRHTGRGKQNLSKAHTSNSWSVCDWFHYSSQGWPEKSGIRMSDICGKSAKMSLTGAQVPTTHNSDCTWRLYWTYVKHITTSVKEQSPEKILLMTTGLLKVFFSSNWLVGVSQVLTHLVLWRSHVGCCLCHHLQEHQASPIII